MNMRAGAAGEKYSKEPNLNCRLREVRRKELKFEALWVNSGSTALYILGGLWSEGGSNLASWIYGQWADRVVGSDDWMAASLSNDCAWSRVSFLCAVFSLWPLRSLSSIGSVGQPQRPVCGPKWKAQLFTGLMVLEACCSKIYNPPNDLISQTDEGEQGNNIGWKDYVLGLCLDLYTNDSVSVSQWTEDRSQLAWIDVKPARGCHS